MAILKKKTAKTDVQKKTTSLHGKPDRGPDYEYAPGEKDRVIAGIAKRKDKAAKDAKNPIKKAVKEVKKVLPKTTISEHREDYENRTRYASTQIKDKKGKHKGFKPGMSREDYVKREKDAGRPVTGRKEVKKGWGKKAKTTMRIID